MKRVYEILASQTVRYVADTLSVTLPVCATMPGSTLDRPERPTSMPIGTVTSRPGRTWKYCGVKTA